MAARPVLALVGWGFTVEDFLQPNGLTLADFCGDFTGSWMFGYADALRTAGVDTVLFCTSSDVSVLTRVEHGATRTAISLLPPPACIDSFARGCSTRTVGGRTPRSRLPVGGGPRRPPCSVPRSSPPHRNSTASFLRELRLRNCDAILCQEYEFPRFAVCVATRRFHRLPVFARVQLPTLASRASRPPVVAEGGSGADHRGQGRGGSSSVGVPRAAHLVDPDSIDLVAWRPRDRKDSSC